MAMIDLMQIQRSSTWKWICSVSSVSASLLLALLAVHGWLIGSSSFSESSLPVLFEGHFLLILAFVLFSTWIAAPLWIVLRIFGSSHEPSSTNFLQVGIFIGGWLLIAASMYLVEISPARLAF